MSRKIILESYENNTVYGVSVFDSYGTEHHLGYSKILSEAFHTHIEESAKKIWANEIIREEDLLGNAIGECVKLDEERGVEPNLD
jgi:hypothetical protein